MLIKATIAAVILATSVGAGKIAVHKFADLQQADNAMLALASPDAIASPNSPPAVDAITIPPFNHQ